MSAAATHKANRSYREVLRNRHVAGLLLGDLLANVGTGMIIVALPVQTLSIHGNVPKAIAIGLVEAAPFVFVYRPQRHLLIAIVGLWAVCPIVLAFVGNLTVAMIVFGLGGLVWAPFTPVAYSFLQSGLEPHEQQQVVTLGQPAQWWPPRLALRPEAHWSSSLERLAG
jgi:MFS family permease